MNKRHPEQLFIPSQESVYAILACYNLPLTRFEPAVRGIENLTLFVWSEGAEYMLRVYPQLKKTSDNSSFQDFLMCVKAFVVELDPSLPAGMSHFDVDIDNILTEDDRITAMLDFDDAQYMSLIVCPGYTLWDVLFEEGGSPERMARYLRIYQEIRQRTQREKELLPQVILFRHYAIATFRMQFGELSQSDFEEALQQAQYLRSKELRF